MALGFPFGFRVAGGKPLDDKFGPFPDLPSALASVLVGERHKGLTVFIGNQEYHWKNGTANADLIVKVDTSQLETISNSQNSASTTVSISGINSYTGNLNPPITSYVKGQTFKLTDIVPNTVTNPTLNFNGLGAKNITNYKSLALSIGDFTGTVIVMYDGTAFRMIGGGSAIVSKYSLYHFNSNLFTEQSSSFRGVITSLSTYLTDQLTAISFEVRLDTTPLWAAQADLTTLQTWINTNISGNESSGTLFWIKVLVIYKSGGLGDAEVKLTYTPS